MKEYLVKTDSGIYLYTKNVSDIAAERVIEVPEGADVFMTGFNTDRGCAFYKDGFNMVHGDNWKWESCRKIDISNHAKTAWQRHTQPEELPFIDDEPKYTDDEVKYMDENGQGRSQSINDQYAEIEKVRQQTDSLPEFKHDFVNHPKHYCDHPSGIECIEITRHHDFAIGNAIKYLWRAGLKDSNNEIQDLKKAVWYIQDKIAQLENK